MTGTEPWFPLAFMTFVMLPLLLVARFTGRKLAQRFRRKGTA